MCLVCGSKGADQTGTIQRHCGLGRLHFRCGVNVLTEISGGMVWDIARYFEERSGARCHAALLQASTDGNEMRRRYFPGRRSGGGSVAPCGWEMQPDTGNSNHFVVRYCRDRVGCSFPLLPCNIRTGKWYALGSIQRSLEDLGRPLQSLEATSDRPRSSEGRRRSCTSLSCAT